MKNKTFGNSTYLSNKRKLKPDKNLKKHGFKQKHRNKNILKKISMLKNLKKHWLCVGTLP